LYGVYRNCIHTCKSTAQRKTSPRAISRNDRSLYNNKPSESYSPSTKGTPLLAVVEDFWTGAPFPGGAIPRPLHSVARTPKPLCYIMLTTACLCLWYIGMVWCERTAVFPHLSPMNKSRPLSVAHSQK